MITAPSNLPNFGDLRVLVVDDSRQSRLIAASILESQGVQQIFFAENGQQALSATFEHVPDLILLDLMMPELDGYAFCRALRQQAGFQETPIIVQTGVEEAHALANAFAAGATDFVRKPIHANELIARTHVHLERLALMKILNTQKLQLQTELQSARAMQEMMLPEAESIQRLQAQYQVEIAVHHQSCQTLSGDLWSAQGLSPHELGLYQVDFSGHGMLAAMNGFRFHALTQSRIVPTANPGEYLTQLNQALHKILPRHCFATFFYGVMNTQTSEMKYSSAAHTAPVILRSNGTLDVLRQRSFPLSIVDCSLFETYTVPFEQGDTMVLFSDALIERWESFDEHVLHHLLKETPPDVVNAKGLLAHLMLGFNASRGTAKLEDDLSLVVMQRV